MSNLSMTQAEEKNIDSKVEQMMDWAKTHNVEAEQLALDSARLMACATDRMETLRKQGFFKRCLNRFSGDTGSAESANVNDIIQMQKIAFRYVNMLQDQQLLMAHSLLSLKNNLSSLAVKEEETLNLIKELASRTLERFKALENRVDKLEESNNLHGWVITLKARGYNKKYPTEYMRLFRIINDFYGLKNDNWSHDDLLYMSTAMDIVGIDPEQKISLNLFIDKLTDEIYSEDVGFDAYGQAITMFSPQSISNYSQFAIDNISSPVFVSMHGLKTQYMDKLDTVEELQDAMNISLVDALKKLLKGSIRKMNVNLDYEFPLAETAIELLGCMRLGEKLLSTEDASSVNQAIPEQESTHATTQDEPVQIRQAHLGNQHESVQPDNSSTILDAILKNDYAPGENKTGLYMKNSAKLNPINPGLIDPFMSVAPRETVLLQYSPKARRIDGDDILFTDNGIIYKKQKMRYPEYVEYKNIASVSQKGRSLVICDNSLSNPIEIDFYENGIFNFINGILRDIRNLEQDNQNIKNTSTDMADECDENSKIELEKRDSAIRKIISEAINYPNESSDAIFIFSINKNLEIKNQIIDLYADIIGENDEILLVFDQKKRYGFGPKIVFTLDFIYEFSEDGYCNYDYDYIQGLNWEQSKIEIKIDNDYRKINVNPIDVNSQFYILKLIDKIGSYLFNANELWDVDRSIFWIIKFNFQILLRGKILPGSDTSTYIKDEAHDDEKFNKKISNFISKINSSIDKDEIIVYRDNTLFGSGDEGFIMTYDTFYYSNSKSDKGQLDYSQIKMALATGSELIITSQYGAHKISCADENVAKAAANALMGIISNERLFLSD